MFFFFFFPLNFLFLLCLVKIGKVLTEYRDSGSNGSMRPGFSFPYSRLQAPLLQIRENVMSTIITLHRPWKWMRCKFFFFLIHPRLFRLKGQSGILSKVIFEVLRFVHFSVEVQERTGASFRRVFCYVSSAKGIRILNSHLKD